MFVVFENDAEDWNWYSERHPFWNSPEYAFGPVSANPVNKFWALRKKMFNVKVAKTFHTSTSTKNKHRVNQFHEMSRKIQI